MARRSVIHLTTPKSDFLGGVKEVAALSDAQTFVEWHHSNGKVDPPILSIQGEENRWDYFASINRKEQPE